MHVNKSLFSFFTSAVNVTLPAFAAERRAAAPLLLGARRPPLLIDISCCTALSSKPAAAVVDEWAYRQTDGRFADS